MCQSLELSTSASSKLLETAVVPVTVDPSRKYKFPILVPLKTTNAPRIALIPIVGKIPIGDELIFAHRRGKYIETQYFTWFGKTAYIHGRDNII